MKKFNEKSLITCISKYLAFNYSQAEVKEKTRINNQCMVNNILRFIEEEELWGVEVEDVDIDFILRFQEWASLIYDRSGTSRHIEIIKKSLDFAVTKNHISHNPVRMIKTPRNKPKAKVILSETELDLLYIYNSKDELKGLSAYYYLLQAETGMSYGDLFSYRLKEENGTTWLINSRIKTKKEYWVPLSERAKELVNRFKKSPFISNVDYNRSIKQVAWDLEIKKHLTTHTARKTFATRMFNNGWSLESISCMMGITYLILVTYYINATEARVKNELAKRSLSEY